MQISNEINSSSKYNQVKDYNLNGHILFQFFFIYERNKSTTYEYNTTSAQNLNKLKEFGKNKISMIYIYFL